MKRLCFFVVFFFSSATKWKDCAIVQLIVIQWGWRCSHADRVCYLDDDWCNLCYQSFYISTCLDYDHMEHYGANAQNTYRRIHKSYCSRPIHTKRCYWAVILERIESRTLESNESFEYLVCQVCQCLSWKTHTCWIKQNLKANCI